MTEIPPTAIEAAAPWTIRVCRKCGSHHGRLHDGCVTYSHPMFPQVTEYAGVDEVEVVPLADLQAAQERAERAEDAAQETAQMWRELRCDYCKGYGAVDEEGGQEDCPRCDGSGVSQELIVRAEKAEAERDQLASQLQEARWHIRDLLAPTIGDTAHTDDEAAAIAFLSKTEPKP